MNTENMKQKITKAGALNRSETPTGSSLRGPLAFVCGLPRTAVHAVGLARVRDAGQVVRGPRLASLLAAAQTWAWVRVV